MSTRYWVRLTKDYLVFSSGHFITFDGTICERLHGHNYRVAAEVHGPSTKIIMWSTSSLCVIARDIVVQLDHRMLHPRVIP